MTYSFGPLERRGILGPIRAGQAVLLALAVVIAIAALDSAPSAAGALAATGVVGLALLAGFAPAAGRTPQEWIEVWVAFLGRRVAAHRRRGGVVALEGLRVPVLGRRRGATAPTPAPPAQLRDVRIVSAEYRGRQVGALSELGGRRLTTVLACRVGAFSLLDAEAQERRLARWGLVLASAGGTAIRRLGWLERTAPAQGDEMARWLHAERDPAVPLRGTAMIDSYLELISSGARVTQDHEILLTVQVDARRMRQRSPDGVLTELLEQTERIAHGVEAAEVVVLGALSPGQIARTVRTAFDPYLRSELAAYDAADRERDGLAEVNAWPLGIRESWDHLRADGALHATYWIGGWPRIDVSPMFMDALLGQSGAVRTMAVTFEPLAPDRSTRDVEAAITRDRADRDLRARFGQSETARQRQVAEATRRRESELAAGHAEVRLSGFVTVSGRDPEELRRSCAEVLEHAARARLELYRLYGQQAEAFTFALPLCRGLR